MFATDQAPGVYYQTVDAGSPPATALRTDIAGFVGIAERGPIGTAVPIESWQQFVSWFGGCTANGYLAYVVRGFLENGGRRCWVVRVASDDPAAGAACAALTLSDAAGARWRVAASSPGVWGNQLSVVLREINRAQTPAVLDPDGQWCAVSSAAGLTRASLVRVTQAGSTTVVYRVVPTVDSTGRLYWVAPDPALALPYDAPVHGFDVDRPVLVQSVEYQLLVSERGGLLRVYDRLSLVPEHPQYGPTVLAVAAIGGASSPEPVVITAVERPATVISPLNVDKIDAQPLVGGRDGLATLGVADFLGDSFSVGVDQGARRLVGLQAISEVDEIALVAVPDIDVEPQRLNPRASPAIPCTPDPCLDVQISAPVPPVPTEAETPPAFTAQDIYRVQAATVLLCEQMRDRFALLDIPRHIVQDAMSGLRGAQDWRRLFDSPFAALSYPWLKVADPLQGPGDLRLIPACGHIAGIVARTDLQRGVHWAPANQQLEWALGAARAVSTEQHAVLNGLGVNVIRTVAGRGLRLVGARTTSSDPDWVFVNVRRLMSMVEKSLGLALQWAVFEPNGFVTRARALMTVTFLLDALHQAGMFAGATAEESYYVRCDLDNNPPEQRDVGQLVVEVGVAPVQPFEFIVVRVGRVGDTVAVRPATADLGAIGTGV